MDRDRLIDIHDRFRDQFGHLYCSEKEEGIWATAISLRREDAPVLVVYATSMRVFLEIPDEFEGCVIHKIVYPRPRPR